MSFKLERASPNGGQLATQVINFRCPYQVISTVPRVNAVFCVNGSISEQPIQFLLDSAAAVSVVNFSVVRQQSITKATTCTVDANGAPLDIVGQTTVTLQLGNFKVNHQFIVVHSLTTECLLEDFLLQHSAIGYHSSEIIS